MSVCPSVCRCVFGPGQVQLKMKNFPTHSVNCVEWTIRKEKDRTGLDWTRDEAIPSPKAKQNRLQPIPKAQAQCVLHWFLFHVRAMQTAFTDWRPTEFFPYWEPNSDSDSDSTWIASNRNRVSSWKPFGLRFRFRFGFGSYLVPLWPHGMRRVMFVMSSDWPPPSFPSPIPIPIPVPVASYFSHLYFD